MHKRGLEKAKMPNLLPSVLEKLSPNFGLKLENGIQWARSRPSKPFAAREREAGPRFASSDFFDVGQTCAHLL